MCMINHRCTAPCKFLTNSAIFGGDHGRENSTKMYDALRWMKYVVSIRMVCNGLCWQPYVIMCDRFAPLLLPSNFLDLYFSRTNFKFRSRSTFICGSSNGTVSFVFVGKSMKLSFIIFTDSIRIETFRFCLNCAVWYEYEWNWFFFAWIGNPI